MITYSRGLQTCPYCHKQYVPELAQRPDWVVKIQDYRDNRQLIQNVWPTSTVVQREQLMSGFCSQKCWDECFQPEDEE